MLCQNCNEKDATVHFTTVLNGKAEEKHLCNSCAKIGNEYSFALPFSINELFTSFLSNIQEDERHLENEKIVCDECGLNYQNFLDLGKFNCPKCYEVFSGNIEELLKGIHGSSHHVGKIPNRANEEITHKREINQLKDRLKDAIIREDFEKAAVLRDEINKHTKDLEE